MDQGVGETKDEDDSKRVPEYRYLCHILFGPQEAEQCSHPITEIMCRRRHRPKEDEDNTVHYSIAAWRDRQTDRSYETMAWNHENWTKKHFKCLRRRTWWIVTKKTMMSSANNILLFFVVFQGPLAWKSLSPLPCISSSLHLLL